MTDNSVVQNNLFFETKIELKIEVKVKVKGEISRTIQFVDQAVALIAGKSLCVFPTKMSHHKPN